LNPEYAAGNGLP